MPFKMFKAAHVVYNSSQAVDVCVSVGSKLLLGPVIDVLLIVEYLLEEQSTHITRALPLTLSCLRLPGWRGGQELRVIYEPA